MKTSLLQSETDLQAMRELMARQPAGPGVVDFEEKIQMASVRAATRLWRIDDRLLAFAFVDDFNNLWFEIDPQAASEQLEAEIIYWGVAVTGERSEPDDLANLDATCAAADAGRIALFEKFGFTRDAMRTLQYERDLSQPVPDLPLPSGFTLRSAAGEQEVQALVELHRQAFGTDYMTVEERLAMMRAPQYAPDLDLLAVAPDGRLAAFCVCGFEDQRRETGYTDPVGVRQEFQGQGLGKAILAAGLRELQRRGARRATLGTSSENPIMQRLAEALGFALVSERLWFSRSVL